ncbi:MAG: FxsA family protein [Myxococcota bacterium]
MGCLGLFLLFTVVPFVELTLLLRLSEVLGFAETLLLVIATGAVGAALARLEGTRVLGEWREALAKGETPAEGVVGGLLVLVGGVLLVTPGVLTDGVGLALMLPPVRRVVGRFVQARVAAGVASGSLHVETNFGFPSPRRDGVVDVQGEEMPLKAEAPEDEAALPAEVVAEDEEGR